MNIKTITCHDVYNSGASLQAYALQTYLESLGNCVEIINYKPDYLSKNYSLTAVNNPAFDKILLKQIYLLMKLPERLKNLKSERKQNFDSFTKQRLHLTKKYSSIEELRNNPPTADVYFAGSDQIWNTFFQNGKDPSFYLDFGAENTIKASYAASFSTTSVPNEYKSQIKQWLSNFNFISVRESSGLDILESLGIKNGVQVMDPVFLLESSAWEQMCTYNTGNDEYILVYDFDGNDKIAEFAKMAADKTGKKIYSIQQLGYADKCFINAGPVEFISLIHNASYVISNSFHATAFSIIFEKEFWVFNRGEKINTRMRDLTASLGIIERLVNDKSDFSIENNIDYISVKKLLNPIIDLSKNYIKDVCNYKM